MTSILCKHHFRELNSKVRGIDSVDRFCVETYIFFMHSKKYHPVTAYNQSKLAQILFTRHLQQVINEDEEWRVQVHAVHPGIVDTELFSNSSTTYIPWIKRIFFKVCLAYK